jgi:hypothetical protein
MVAHACMPSTWEAEARGSRVQGQLGLHSETLFRKKKKNTQAVDSLEILFRSVI